MNSNTRETVTIIGSLADWNLPRTLVQWIRRIQQLNPRPKRQRNLKRVLLIFCHPDADALRDGFARRGIPTAEIGIVATEIQAR